MSCPICQNDTAPKYRPFCSRRCADIDLARWMNGAYALAGDETDNAEGPAPEDPQQH